MHHGKRIGPNSEDTHPMVLELIHHRTCKRDHPQAVGKELVYTAGRQTHKHASHAMTVSDKSGKVVVDRHTQHTVTPCLAITTYRFLTCATHRSRTHTQANRIGHTV